jgi:FMN phosphatase YigB (HAD superfamily)
MKKYAFFDVDNTVYNGYTVLDILFLILPVGIFVLASIPSRV